MKPLRALGRAMMLTGGIGFIAHGAMVTTLKEWATISQQHAYSIGFDEAMSFVWGIASVWVYFLMHEADRSREHYTE